MSDQALNILKYFLLALVWLFFLRILRVVWVEIRTGDAGGGAPGGGDMSERAGVIPAVRGARARRAAARPATPVPLVPPAPAPAPAPPPGPAPSAAPAPAPTPVPVPGARAPARLRVAEPEEMAGRTFPLPDDGELVIGRATSAALALPGDSFVSSRHARVFRRDGGVWVEDLGSTNGTYVNGGRISAATPLRTGDRLQVGRTVLEAGA